MADREDQRKKGNENDTNNDDTADIDDDHDEGANAKSPTQLYRSRLQAQMKKRMESNRIHARTSRRRKREKIEEMTKECLALEEENRQLRIRLRVGKEAEEIWDAENKKGLQELEKAVQRRATLLDMIPLTNVYVDRFADWGVDRPASVEFHARSVGRLLSPDLSTMVITSFLSCLKNSADPQQEQRQEMWKELIRHLELSPWQLQELQKVDNDTSYQRQCGETLQELRESHLRFHLGMSQIIEGTKNGNPMTAKSAARFFVWVAKNAACMQMLNELWMELYRRSHECDEEEEEQQEEDGSGSETEEQEEQQSSTNTFYTRGHGVPSDYEESGEE